MPRRPLFPAILVSGSLVLLGLAVLGASRLMAYVDRDPGLCAQCHRASPEFALWSRGSHRSVACQRCHHSTRQQQLVMLRAFLAGRSPADRQEHATVQVGACASCHLSHDANWPQVGGSRGHAVHVAQEKIGCVTCHAAGVHGFEPVVTACRACHGEHGVREAVMGRLHCFAWPRLPLQGARAAPHPIRVLQNRSEIFAARGDRASARTALEQALACAESLPPGQRSEGTIQALKKKLETPPAS